MTQDVLNQLNQVAVFFWQIMGSIWNTYMNTILVIVIALYIVSLLVRWFKRMFF